MRRAIAFLGLALVAAGCGSKPGADTTAAAATGKPAPDEAKACIAAYMAQCGWKEVDVVRLVDRPEVPAGARTPGTVWAYSFSATYTNIFGERQTTEDWVAVVGRDGETPRVTSCFDDGGHLVGGHSGAEEFEKAVVTAPKP